ncbi:MAG: TIGR04283 family arsenosugar biosynthesis glycosyltransferase [Bacteroidota bacterium]
MHLSIIIPTLNERENIQKLIPHLFHNSGLSLVEIIVVDAEKSEDGTAEVAEQAGARVIRCADCSRAVQMNLGASHAAGDVLYFVHADALPPASYVSDIQAAMQEDNDFGFFSYQFDSKKPWLKINSYFTRFDGLFSGGGDQTLFIQKRAFQLLNGFNAKLKIMEDFDLTKRARKKNFSFKIIKNDVLVSARKYDRNPYLWVNFVNLIIFVMYWLGSPSSMIKTVYRRLLF